MIEKAFVDFVIAHEVIVVIAEGDFEPFLTVLAAFFAIEVEEVVLGANGASRTTPMGQRLLLILRKHSKVSVAVACITREVAEDLEFFLNNILINPNQFGIFSIHFCMLDKNFIPICIRQALTKLRLL